MHAELPIVSFLCCLLVLAPLPWHWRAGTVPTIAITFWMFLGNLINGVNAIVWADNVIVRIPVWCDIATKITIGSNIALPTAILCLCIQLEQVSSTRQVQTSLADKRRRRLWHSVFCFIVPVFYMALHYVVQGHRFDIIEDFGCRANIYISYASTFLIWVPPLTLSVVAAGYSAVALHHFWVRRITFARHLQSNNSALTASHYFRLMSMALVQIFWTVFIIAFNMGFGLRNGLREWISWDDVHVNFGRIAQFPTVLIPHEDLVLTYMLWWTIPVSAVLFFSFFSFGQEAMKEYRKCGRWVKYTLLRFPKADDTAKPRPVGLPSFVSPSPPKLRFSSFDKPPLSPHSTATLAGSESSKHKDVDLDVYDIRRDSAGYVLDVPYTPQIPHSLYIPSSPGRTETTAHSTVHGDDEESIISMYATHHASDAGS